MPGPVSPDRRAPSVGFFDLIYANIATFKDHVDPAQLGTSYYLAALNVPAMVVVHILIFTDLLRWRAVNGAHAHAH